MKLLLFVPVALVLVYLFLFTHVHLSSNSVIVPTPTLSPTTIPTVSPVQKTSSYTPQVNTQTMASEPDLDNAVNIYRHAHAQSSLTVNPKLCQEAQKRIQDLALLNGDRQPGNLILNHDGIQADLDSGRLQQLVGLHRYGENVASSFCRRPSDNVSVNISTGTQLVEWCFDSSPSHKENLLQPYWTDVCSVGVYPFYVEEFAY